MAMAIYNLEIIKKNKKGFQGIFTLLKPPLLNNYYIKVESKFQNKLLPYFVCFVLISVKETLRTDEESLVLKLLLYDSKYENEFICQTKSCPLTYSQGSQTTRHMSN